ncbi:MAG: hypothetical protein K0B81_01305 [Candidatus Cloacimonetes bacterium]|nr:hypothetical protein [Candidatus Cloacimonadota bacterium]
MYKIILLTLLLLASTTLTARTFNVGLRTGMIMAEHELEPGIINGLTIGYYLTPLWKLN